MNIAALPRPLRALALATAFIALLHAANPAWPAADAPRGPLAQAPAASVPGWLAAPAGSAPRVVGPASPPIAPRQLLISVRYGGASQELANRSVTASSHEAAGEDVLHFRVQNGERVLIASRRSSPAKTHQVEVLDTQAGVIANRRNPPAPAQRYARVSSTAEESGSMIEVEPTLSGNTALVRMVAQRRTVSPGGSGGSREQHIETTLSLPLGEWTEVSGRGPWPSSETRDTASTRDARNDARRVFIKIEEMGR